MGLHVCKLPPESNASTTTPDRDVFPHELHEAFFLLACSTRDVSVKWTFLGIEHRPFDWVLLEGMLVRLDSVLNLEQQCNKVLRKNE